MNNFQEKAHQGFENDLKLYYCGKRIRNIEHSFGPYDKGTFLLYFIKEGSATLLSNGKESQISAPGFFVNYPHSQNTYCANKNTYWSIKWIVIDGSVIEKYLSLMGMSPEKPYIKLNDTFEIEMLFDELYETFDKTSVSSKIYCISLVHKLFSLLIENSSHPKSENKYVLSALEMIGRNFSDPNFNVGSLAKMLGLHYNYFSIQFKKETGISPQKAIMEYRINSACKMLRFTNAPIKEVALKCGFADEFYFSRRFKKEKQLSPSEYRLNRNYLT